MQRSEKLVLACAMLVPLVVVTVGWPKFVEWLGRPAQESNAEVAGAAATAPPAAPSASTQQAIAAPTRARGRATATPVPRQAPTVAVREDRPGPDEAVADFYALVTDRQFAQAAQLWSPRMRSRYPPAENIDQRFSQTQSIQLRHAEVVAESGTQASVGVDVVEVMPSGRTNQFVGAWHLVRGPGGWLLDEPELRLAP
jgi:hypothetical protein